MADAPPTRDQAESMPARPGTAGERFWSLAFPGVTALLAVAVAALLIAGRTVVLDSTDGDLTAQGGGDPTAPGWQAVAEPTPTALVVHRDAAGRLAAATLLSLTGPDAGALVLLPVDTMVDGRPLVDIAGTVDPAGDPATGEAAVRAAVEQVLDLAPTDVVTMGAEDWRSIVGPAAPLRIDNPDDVFALTAGLGQALRFRKGSIDLPAADVDDYLAIRNAGESDLNRLVRHEAFWRAWLDAVGRGPAADGAVGAEQAGVLARYVRGLSTARLDVSTLPVQVTQDQTLRERFVPVDGQVRSLVGRVVPFPVSGPGARLKIRLLDGTGALHHGLDAAGALVGAGGQIDQIGNAASFGVATTRLDYADERHRPKVEELAAALGTGEIAKVSTMDTAVDVVVTLGQDYRAHPGEGVTAPHASGSVPS